MRDHKQPDLEATLDAYAEAVKPTSTGAGWRTSLGNWPVYAAATGSALALSTSAGASIIHGFANSSVTVPTSFGSHNASNYFTVGAPPSAVAYPYLLALNFRFPPTSTTGGGILPGYGVGVLALEASCGCTDFFIRSSSPFALNYPLRRFASGEMISGGGSPALSTQGFLALKCTGVSSVCGPGGTSVHPEFQSNVYGLAGFQAHGYFGWIRLKWEADAGSGFPNKLTVLDWAYEDSGGAIAAGDTGAAPEPGTMSMGLLAAGAAGIAAWRKRKKCAA